MNVDKIFIKGLALEATIGIYEHERGVKQPIKVDLDIFFDNRLPAKSGLIKDTIDYDLVAQEIGSIVATTKFELLESLAESIANTLVTKFKISKLACTVYKPQALNNAETVGITISRPVA